MRSGCYVEPEISFSSGIDYQREAAIHLNIKKELLPFYSRSPRASFLIHPITNGFNKSSIRKRVSISSDETDIERI